MVGRSDTPARFGIIGGGIVGLAVARRLLELRPGATVTVLEKEDGIGRHQTGHNSGVAHAGLYYEPGSLKAILCRRGVALLKDFCAEHTLPYEECGKLVVALDEEQATRLRTIEQRARANQVPGLRLLGPPAMREVEPEVTGVLGLHSPTTAAVDFGAVARALARDVHDAGGTIEVGFHVDDVRQSSQVVVGAGQRRLDFDRVVICAGLYADRVSRLAGDADDPRIVPFRGEYHRLAPSRAHLVRGLIYPVPDPRFPFLGVHFTRRIDGHVDLGPNAVLALARQGYRRRDVVGRDVADILSWPGMWRFARRHYRTGASEALTSLSTRLFVRRAKAYVPAVTARDVIPAPAGVRAQAVDRAGPTGRRFRTATTWLGVGSAQRTVAGGHVVTGDC